MPTLLGIIVLQIEISFQKDGKSCRRKALLRPKR